MGCWNETCALSNLPIMRGAPTYLIFMMSAPTTLKEGQTGCYVDDFWLIPAIPLLGKYDDYGRVDQLEKGLFAQLVAEQIQATLVPHEEHEGKFNLMNLQNWCHDGNCKIKAPLLPPKTEHELVKTFIRKDVWDWFVTQTVEDFRGAHTLQTMQKDAAEYLNCWTIKQDEINKIEDPNERLSKLFGMDFEMETSLLGKNQFYSHFKCSRHGRLPWTLGHYDRQIQEKYRSGSITKETALEIYNRIAEIMHVEAVMSELRICWHPTSFSGSQDQDYRMHAAFHTKIAEIATKTAVYLEDY